MHGWGSLRAFGLCDKLSQSVRKKLPGRAVPHIAGYGFEHGRKIALLLRLGTDIAKERMLRECVQMSGR